MMQLMWLAEWSLVVVLVVVEVAAHCAQMVVVVSYHSMAYGAPSSDRQFSLEASSYPLVSFFS